MKEQDVEVCDATKFNSITAARYKKKSLQKTSRLIGICRDQY